MLQNLPYFMYVYENAKLLFHFVLLYFFTSSITVFKRKTCTYLSPDFPLRAARTGQRPLGRLKQLREENREFFTCALFTLNTVMLDVIFAYFLVTNLQRNASSRFLLQFLSPSYNEVAVEDFCVLFGDQLTKMC